MLKFIIELLSKALAFTKTETRGTLILIFIIFIGLILSNYRIFILEKRSELPQDSTALKWIKEVHSSIEIRQIKDYQSKKVMSYETKPLEKIWMNGVRKETKSKYKKKDYTIPKEVYDLNQSSADQLQMVKGIGPIFSQRIIKYRNVLGGYSNISQLKEVYGIENEIIEELVKYFDIKSPVLKFKINSDSIKKLVKHPYISYDLARVIINYRKMHGNIENAEDLKKIKSVDDSTFIRLEPYLE